MIKLQNMAAAAAAVLLTAGCAASGGDTQWSSSEGPLPAYSEETTVQVQNNNWSDVVIYATRYNARVRLGMVTSMNTRKFEMPRSVSLATGSIELVAEPIGSRDRYLTGPISVVDGQQVQLKIENQLPISTYSVW